MSERHKQEALGRPERASVREGLLPDGLLGLLAAISVQKNVRDIAAHRDVHPDLDRRPERNEPPAPPQWTV